MPTQDVRGHLLIDAPDGTTANRDTPGVYGVRSTAPETLQQCVDRVRANPATPKTPRNLITNIQAINTPPPTPGTFVDWQIPTKKWVGTQFFHSEQTEDGKLFPGAVMMYELAKEKGCNMSMPCLQWLIIEPTKGTYDFRLLADICALHRRLNLPMLPRIGCHRNTNGNANGTAPGNFLIAPGDMMVDNTGQARNDGNMVMGSVNSVTYRSDIEIFLRIVLNWIIDNGYSDLIMGVEMSLTGQMEGEYIYENIGGDGNAVTRLFDYSVPAQNAFREYMRNHPEVNGDVNALNARWGGTTYQFSNNLHPAMQAEGDYFYFNTQQRKDFFAFRTVSLANWTNYFAGVIKSFSTKWQTLSGNGNLQDDLSFLRASLVIQSLYTVDGMKSNDEPGYPLYLSTAICLRNRAPGRWACNETFTGIKYSIEEMVGQTIACFDAGNAMVIMAGGFLVAGMDRDPTANPAATQLARERLTQTMTQILAATNLNTPADTSFTAQYSINASTLVTTGYGNGVSGGPSPKLQFAALEGNNHQNGVQVTVVFNI